LKISSRVIAATAAIALAGVPAIFSTDAASATPVTPTLTYAEFAASQGYQDLMALGAQSQAAFANMQGLEQDTTVHASVTADTNVDVTVNIKTNKVDSTATTTTAPAPGVIAGTTTYYFSNGHYVFDATTFGTAFKNNTVNESLTRLGKPASSAISTTLTTAPSPFSDISPTAFTSKVSQDGLLAITLSKLNMLFTPVVCAAPTDAPSTNVCNYRASAIIDSFATFFIDVELTFDSTGFMSNMTIDESTDPVGFVMNLTVSQKPLNAWTQTLPQSVVADTAITKMGRQVGAETIAGTGLNKVIAKAKTLAKKAKKPLDANFLNLAAKVLGQKATKVKGGIKVSAKWQNISGSSCAVVTKGKASVNHC
jgi:hypothetical protein